MMFQCKNCPTMVGNGQPMHKIVTARRQKMYEKLVGRGPNKRVEMVPGWEIVKEIPVCPQCFTAYTGKDALIFEAPKPAPRPSQKPFQKKRFDKDNRNNNRDRRFDHKLANNPRREQLQKERRAPVVQLVNPLPTVK